MSFYNLYKLGVDKISLLDYDHNAAFQSLNNIKGTNFSFNISDYPNINQMTSANTSNTDSMITAFFTPITGFWAANAVLGSWFYVLLIIITVGIVYIKSQSVHRASIAMLLMGLCASAPGGTGVIYIPSSALYTLYIFTGFGLLGVLYSFWVGD